jgi:hypothetical protein
VTDRKPTRPSPARKVGTGKAVARRPTATHEVLAAERETRQITRQLRREMDASKRAEDRILYETKLKELRAIAGMGDIPDLRAFTADMWEEMNEPAPVRRFAIDRLAGDGHIVTLPATRKTGKTTLLANAGLAGAAGLPFLGEFDTHLDGTVYAVNAEMTRWDYLDTWRNVAVNLGLSEGELKGAATHIKFLHCREEGIRLDFTSDAVCGAITTNLYDWGARWWFLDPWKDLLAWSGVKMNDNAGVAELLQRIRTVADEAEVRLTVISMHTTQQAAEPGYERGKGAGELEDGADALWRYSRIGPGSDAPRVLAAEGRGGVGLPETVIDFDAGTEVLRLGSGDRYSAAASGNADIVQTALECALLKEPFASRESGALATSELEAVVPGTKGARISKIRDAVAAGTIVRTAAEKGRTIWYSLPS